MVKQTRIAYAPYRVPSKAGTSVDDVLSQDIRRLQRVLQAFRGLVSFGG